MVQTLKYENNKLVINDLLAKIWKLSPRLIGLALLNDTACNVEPIVEIFPEFLLEKLNFLLDIKGFLETIGSNSPQ